MSFRNLAVHVCVVSAIRLGRVAHLFREEEWDCETRIIPPSAVGGKIWVTRARNRGAWLALTLGVALLPSVGQAQDVEWARSAGGTLTDEGSGIAVDAAGNSYVTGHFKGTASFGAFTLTSADEWDIFVAKHDTCGNGSVDPDEVCNDGGESAMCDPNRTVPRPVVHVRTRYHFKKEEQVR